MKKCFLALLILNFSFLFASTVEDFRSRLEIIENFKRDVMASKSGDESFSQLEIDTLNQLYAILENDEYTVSSRMDQMNFSVKPYDIEGAYWPLEMNAEILKDNVYFSKKINMDYSVLLEKRYVKPEEMTSYQRADYEYYVNEYENFFLSGRHLIFAEMTFKVKHWKDAGEYRFKPTHIKLYKITRNNRLIKTYDLDEFSFFTVSPSVEYRNAQQYLADSTAIDAFVENENKKEELALSAEKEKPLIRFEKRRSFYLAADIEDFKPSDINISNLKINNIEGFLTWGINDYLFGGIGITYDIDSMESDAVYGFNGIFGANICITDFIRPFAKIGLNARSDDRWILKVGCGTDIKFGHFMLITSFDYNWNRRMGESTDPNTHYSSVTAGFGITW